MKKIYKYILLFVCHYLVCMSCCCSQDLDLSFGNGTGKLLIELGNDDQCNSVALQGDGKIVLGGGTVSANGIFSIVRLDSDGSFDNSFNATGKKIFSAILTGDYGKSIKINNQGKIIMGGSAGTSTQAFYAITNLNTDGSFNTAFNNNIDTISVDSIYHLNTLTSIDVSNTRILLAGYSGNFSNLMFSAAVLKMDGTFDQSFNSTGKLILPSSGGALCYASLFQKDGKILLAGTANDDFIIIRLNEDGSFDNTFGGGTGQVSVDFNGDQDYVYSLAQQKDGKILAAGHTGSSIALARLNMNGSLDNAFGPNLNGKISISFGSQFTSICNSIALDTFATNNKIILAGYGYRLDNRYGGFATIRLDLNGNVEAQAIIPMGTSAISVAKSVAIQPDSKIIMTGYASNGTDNDFAAIRLLPDFTTTAVAEAETTINAGVNIFPNPASYQLNIHSSYNITNIILYNTLGEPVMSVVNNNDVPSVIDISALNKGIYTAVISTDRGNAVKKIVKQ